MQPALGWTVLSREALRRAETHLRDGERGVRDEVGFLALHQAYADRFFPGTSVLQTRLRYVFFIPWIYERISHQKGRRINSALQAEEVQLAGRLKAANEDGIIGGRVYPRPTSQAASMIYWNALRTWGILRTRFDNASPARSTLHRSLSKSQNQSRVKDDNDHPLEVTQTYFVSLPKPPKDWNEITKPINFNLLRQEADFIRQHLIAVPSPGLESTPSLLARLVEEGIPVAGIDLPWAPIILAAADPMDRAALIRARQASSLTAIGRAIYAALVEEMRDREDNLPTESRHRDYLETILAKHKLEAAQLDVSAIVNDAPAIPERILNLLAETQQWLKNGRQFYDLYPCYEQIERERKGTRARLTQTLAAKKRRQEWQPEEHPLASPLHYRWENVRRLLNDLGAAL